MRSWGSRNANPVSPHALWIPAHRLDLRGEESGRRRHPVALAAISDCSKSQTKLTVNLIRDIVLARREKGLTQTALAEAIGSDRAAIARLEAGVGPLSLLLQIMEALQYHVAGLAKGTRLPEQLRNRRLSMKLSTQELAQRAGVSRATISALERGNGTIAPLVKVLDILCTSTTARRKPTPSLWLPSVAADRNRRFTPVEFLQAIAQVWGAIDLDPCGHPDSPVGARRRISLEEGGDGLREDWSGDVVYVNPPFSDMVTWLKRADQMWIERRVQKIIALVPARTDIGYFHDRIAQVCDVGLMRGRLQFGQPNSKKDDRSRATFALMVCLWGATAQEIDAFDAIYHCRWLARDKQTMRSASSSVADIIVPRPAEMNEAELTTLDAD